MGFSVLVLRTLKSLAQLPHPSPLDAHSLLKNGEVPRASPGPGASHSACPFTWNAGSLWAPHFCSVYLALWDVLRFPSALLSQTVPVAQCVPGP